MSRLLAGSIVGLLVAAVLPTSADAAYSRWVQRELVDKVRFQGKFDACDYGDSPRSADDHYSRAIPGPAKEAKVVSPKAGTVAVGGGGAVTGSIKQVRISASTPHDHVVHIEFVARAHVCFFRDVDWETEFIKVRVRYKQLVSATVAPVISCDESFERVRRLSARRTTCFYALSVARRYVARANSRLRRSIAPFTCVEVPRGGYRAVTCRAPGPRFVSFRYSLGD